MSRMVTLIALALATAAIATSVAGAGNGTQATKQVDPLAVSYLLGKGYTQAQVDAWTVGACSHEVKPAACFGPSKGANLTNGGAVKVDPLAVSNLIGRGLSPSQVQSWTTGACSHANRDAACYAMFEPAAEPTVGYSSTGFSWSDAGIGAAATLGLVLLLGGVGIGFLSRHNRRDQMARA